MSNMSYCKFHNTYLDLCDCSNTLVEEGLENLSERERNCAEKMYDLCREYMENYESAVEDEENEEYEEVEE